MGCIISPILLVLAMEVILRAADLGGGCYMPPLMAFMDDTTILCSKENETRRMLVWPDALMKWSRMRLKPAKSQSLSMQGRRRCLFQSSQSRYNKDQSWPVKSLGRWYDSSLKDTKRGSEALKQASMDPQVLDNCGLSGKYKMWCLQFICLSQSCYGYF
ncbi:reverse transcriptase [Plakobranchus ocellatus]|uniref:Reverse transcriptase n=1 Tax=Plakobranchus ocellatus TaxID=259542 RepID=A0AAV3Z6J3_9GAST|nr:reverse transcriptase [Plakobranchus ocellatus]